MKVTMFTMATANSNVKLGLRVVRGPHWAYGEDIPDGLLGTIVELRSQTGTVPGDSVSVLWDSGVWGCYRTGYGNAYDLCAIDNLEGGAFSPLNDCHGCGERGFSGFKWSCSVCANYNLCSSCYMSDKHETRHQFNRFEAHTPYGFTVPARYDSIFKNDKILAKGIFKDAVVSRSQGGCNEIGQVLDVSRDGCVAIRWISGTCSTHRLGQSGLECIRPSIGGYYYKSHLPVVGLKKIEVPSIQGFNFGGSPPITFSRPVAIVPPTLERQTIVEEINSSRSREFSRPDSSLAPINRTIRPSSGSSVALFNRTPFPENDGEYQHVRFVVPHAQGTDASNVTKDANGAFPYQSEVTVTSESGSRMTINLKFSGNVDLSFSKP